VRRRLQAVAEGKSQTLGIDLNDAGVDTALIVRQLTARHQPDGRTQQRLAAAFQRSGDWNKVVDSLAAGDAVRRSRSARMAGALDMHLAVPWLSSLLLAHEPVVRHAAAKALGKIGGTRSAEALLRAIQRRGPTPTLIVELARAAPDLFLETALCVPQRTGVKGAVAVAAGLRRRRAAVTPLLALLGSGTRRERAISCRALAWIGAGTAIPAIAVALGDSDWMVRMSAVKALAALKCDGYMPELDALLVDRNIRVRKAAQNALRRLRKEMAPRLMEWLWL